jgi:predicted RNA-binding protein with PUA-like domain
MWLLKTEPDAYSYGDLERDGETTWDGVTNPVALKNLREMKAGDRVIVYHTGDERSAVGIAKVAKGPYPDPKSGNPKRVVVDLVPVAALKTPVTLAEIKALAIFANSPLVRQGRLSVVPLDAAQWKAIAGRE